MVSDAVGEDFPAVDSPMIFLLDGHKARFSVPVLNHYKANHVTMVLGMPNPTRVF